MLAKLLSIFRTMCGLTAPPKFGESKPLESITLDDVLAHPIWVWAIDEEDKPGQDETWQKPVINTSDVSHHLVDPIITIRIKGRDIHGSATYNHRRKMLNGISLWIDGKWVGLREAKDIPHPLFLIAIPTIRGKSNMEFRCDDFASDEATQQ